MAEQTSRQWVLAKRPVGEPTDDCFELREVPVPALEDGQVLVDVHYLSLDPYMRGRMRDAKSYADPLAIATPSHHFRRGGPSEASPVGAAVDDHLILTPCMSMVPCLIQRAGHGLSPLLRKGAPRP